MFCFSILLSRRIGPGGMGLYQLVMPVYSLFLCLAGGGITISVSKLTAEEKARHNFSELYTLIRSICIAEGIWSFLLTILLVGMAGFLSQYAMNEPKTKYMLYAISPAIFFVSLSSVFKGAYYGLQQIAAPALIDIVEKIIRIALILLLLRQVEQGALTQASTAAILSLSIGEFVSLLLFYIAFLQYKKKHAATGKSDNPIQLIVNTLRLALPLALNGIVSTVFAALTTLIIPARLEQTGMTHEASVMLLGKLQGMVLTIVLYPTVVVSSMNVLLIPALSEALAAKRTKTLHHHINKAFLVASVTAFSSAALLLAVPNRIGALFYSDASLGIYLKQLGYGIPFFYLEITSFAILNGLGRQKNILINSTLLSIVELLLLYFLLGTASINVQGYGINFFILSLLGLLINLFMILHKVSIRLNLFSIFILPTLCFLLTLLLLHQLQALLANTALLLLFGYTFFFLIFTAVQKMFVK